MQREVLNRSVACDGHDFPVGTPIELIPVHNRESCQRSGWTHVVNVVEPGESGESGDQNKDQSDLTDQSDLKEDQADQADQSNQSDQSDQSDQSEQSELNQVADANANTVDVDVNANANTAQADDNAQPLGETELELRVVELLAAAGITTRGQAREYLAANKTFRIIEGVGKASDAAIRLVIGAE